MATSSLENALAGFGEAGANQQRSILAALGPGFQEALGALLQGGGFNQLGLNNQYAQIGAQAQADLNRLNADAAMRGFGNFGGAQAINAARLGTAAAQKSDALAQEQELSHQRTLQNLGFLQNTLFGGSNDAAGQALGAQQADKDRKAARTNAMIGAVGSIIGGFCWVARAVFGTENAKWLDARNWIVNDSPDWFYDWYGENGKAFARRVERSLFLRLALRPAFEVIAWLGRR